MLAAKAATLSYCLKLNRSLALRPQTRRFQDLIWQFPNSISGNDAYKSLLSPKFEEDYLRTLRIQTFTLLEKCGLSFGIKEVKGKGSIASKGFLTWTFYNLFFSFSLFLYEFWV